MLTQSQADRVPNRVQEQGARSRERILDAAEKLMAERGFAASSISAICRESGLPASSVYWHFHSKDGLLEAVVERGSARMLDELRAAYQAAGSPRERLHRMMVRAADVFENRPQEFRRLQMRISLDPPRSDNLRAAIDRIRENLGSLMEEALFEIFRSEGETLAREIAVEGSAFARILAQGTELEAIRNPDTFDPNHILKQAEIALLSLGEKRLAEKRKNPE